jgi:hypothetical protein
MSLISHIIKTIIAYIFLVSYASLFVLQNFAIFKQNKYEYAGNSKSDIDDEDNLDDDINDKDNLGDDINDKDDIKKLEEICQDINFNTNIISHTFKSNIITYDAHQLSLYSSNFLHSHYTPPDFI